MPSVIYTISKIIKVLSNLEVVKSPGLDEIHPKMPRELQAELADCLKIVFNKSLISKQSSSLSKNARVVAIYQKQKQETCLQQACAPLIYCVQGDRNT